MCGCICSSGTDPRSGHARAPRKPSYVLTLTLLFYCCHKTVLFGPTTCAHHHCACLHCALSTFFIDIVPLSTVIKEIFTSRCKELQSFPFLFGGIVLKSATVNTYSYTVRKGEKTSKNKHKTNHTLQNFPKRKSVLLKKKNRI